MQIIKMILSVLTIFAVCGCTSLNEIRNVDLVDLRNEVDIKDDVDFKCKTGSPKENEPSSMIEDYQRYWLSFLEFDDQGWSHSGQRQLNKLEDRLRGELIDPQYKEVDFQVILFIHGWHHNAYDNDCNVQEFRSMLKRAADDYDKSGPHKKRRLIGIYVGWRGESVNARGLNYLTVLDRRNSAEHIAKGQVRELFAVLRKHELASNGIKKEDEKHRNKMRSMVIGHSFGGLIAYHGLSQAMLSEFVQEKPSLETGCGTQAWMKSLESTPTWPDLLVLINPAFEASRFEAIHNAMRPVAGCPYADNVAPKLIVVTADNDWATGPVFTVGRRILSMFEHYSTDNDGLHDAEKAANLHAIGFVHRYRTHRFCLIGPEGARKAVAAFTPSPDVDPRYVQDHRAPVWVIGAPPDIIDGHNGFLYAEGAPGKTRQPFLLDWLVGLNSHHPNHGLESDTPLLEVDGSCGPWVD